MNFTENQRALLSHAGTFFSAFIIPLIILFTAKDTETFVKEHAKESLNFQLSLAIYLFIASLLAFLIIPVILMGAIVLYSIVQVIQASIAAHEGKPFTYGMTIRLIK